MYKNLKIVDMTRHKLNYLILFITVFVLIALVAYNLILVEILHKENEELKTSIETMLIAQEHLVEVVNDELEYMQKTEKKLCQAMETGFCK